ncbi:MAG: glycosyltransferase family 2 protein [Magnetococcales bacterium]|nr:glycosyltransferase family 2 protein [Magnetococcales bacterium]MBF0116172.1 glycosyltransferase family 2 protein [Magnetococcales bacterium]
MQQPFSIIMPYRGTPSVTRVALHALQRFTTTAPEIILMHHQEALSVEEEIMLGEFPELRRIVFPTTLSSGAADIACLDQGIAAASHEHVVLIQGDTVFLKWGWNEEIFSFMQQAELDAIGTQATEANPCRVWYRRFGDIVQEVFHKRRPDPKSTGSLRLHFLVSKKSALEKMAFRFQQQKPLDMQHFLQAECKLNLFSMQEVTSILWHIPHTIPLLRSELHDKAMAQDLWEKWRTFWTDPFILEHFSSLSDGMEQAFRNIAALQQR